LYGIVAHRSFSIGKLEIPSTVLFHGIMAEAEGMGMFLRTMELQP
jgi:hypothetical protein